MVRRSWSSILVVAALLCVEVYAQTPPPSSVAYDEKNKVTTVTEDGRTSYLCFDEDYSDESMYVLLTYPAATYLELSKTKVGDSVTSALAGFTGIKTLRLADTQVGDGALGDLTALTQLEVLDLSGTQVTDAGLDQLARIPRLKELRLSGTKITDAGLEKLTALENLELLWVNDTQVTPEAVHRLEDALRKTRELADGVAVDTTVNVKYSPPPAEAANTETTSGDGAKAGESDAPSTQNSNTSD